MGKPKKKPANRMLAVTLSMAITAFSAPLYVFAETELPASESVQNEENTVNDTAESSVTTTAEAEMPADLTEESAEDSETIPHTVREEFNLHISIPENMKQAVRILLNGQETMDISARPDDEIRFEATALYVNEQPYRLSSVKTGGNSLFKDDLNGRDSYQGNFVLTQEMIDTADENGNIDINIELMQVYQVQFFFDAQKGTVETTKEYFALSKDNPEQTIGTVILNQNENLSFTAKPNENYRISEIRIDENTEKYAENDNEITIDSLTPSQNHNITVIFALNQYSIYADENISNGNITVSESTVDYGTETTVTLNADEGYYIRSISVNDKKIPASEIKDNSFKITDITENKKISAEFASYAENAETYFDINTDSAVKYDGRSCVFSKGTNAVFSTHKQGIRLIDRNDNVLSGNEESKEVILEYRENPYFIKAVEIYYQDSEYTEAGWHKVLFDDVLKISFYEGAEVSVELPELVKPYTCYSTDITAVVNIDIPDKDYPGITKIEYRINDETEYTELEDITQRKIVIPVQKYNGMNNRIDVMVTDADGNVKTASADFSVNTAVPTVSVRAGDTVSDGAYAGYYNKKRSITVSITDREDTLNESLDAFIIKKNGTEMKSSDKAKIVRLSKSGDVLTATIDFDYNGKYEFDVLYTNLAGVHNESVISNEEESVYSFTVDKCPPMVYMGCEGNLWLDILDVLTFRTFKDSEIEVSVIAEDVNGINEMSCFIDYRTTDLGSISEKARTFEELESMYHAENSPFELYKNSFKVRKDEKAVIYARVTDRAGNIAYINSNGLIIDGTAPEFIEISTDADAEKEIQNRAVKFDVNIKDTVEENKAFSGIKRVSYAVRKDGENIGKPVSLYTWNTSDDSLCNDWSGSFTLDPHEISGYNQDNLEITVTVEDNSGNKITSEPVYISMDINAMSADVRFEDDTWNENRLDENYFTSRKAVVTIENNRESSFNAENADEAVRTAITVTELTDPSGKILDEIPEDLIKISEWKYVDNKYTATVEFKYSGNYTWNDTVYTNNAGNSVNLLNGNTLKFTIDEVKPEVSFKTVDDPWSSLLNVLTFGIYTKDSYEISAEASDITSPVVIDYYISHSTEPLNEDNLNSLPYDSWQRYSEPFKIENPDKYVIYVRATDNAGNYSYVCSDGHIIDNSKPHIKLSPENAVAELNGKPVYNKDYEKNGIKVNVSVSDDGNYSGLKSVEYWIEADGVETQRETLYSFDNVSPSYQELCSYFEDTITVDAKSNNSSNVSVYVKCIDNADNETTESVALDIDINEPKISVSYDNNSDNNGNTYFDKSRKATVCIKERANHFDSKTARENIKITAVDIDGNPVSDAFVISNWNTVTGDTPEQDIHTAEISYNASANYTFEISYTDRANNKNTGVDTGDSVSPYKFTVDMTKPTGTITALSAEGREVTWDKLANHLYYGFWSNTNINVSGTSDDRISPVASVEYYKVSSKNASDVNVPLTETDLQAVTVWQKFEELNIQPNEQFVVYLKIKDMAGNTQYISTNGLIVDNDAPHQEFNAPEINITPQQSESGIYNSDVPVKISVDDPLTDGTYSGIKTVRYRVLNMGAETQSGTLYSFNGETPEQSELIKSWEGEIVIDSGLNNSNDVVIEVYAEDNADNGSNKERSMKIDVTPPSVQVEYNNNTSNGSLFKNARKATVYVKERNFNENYVNLLVNGQIYHPVNNWVSKGGTGNGDDTVWTADVLFNSDGDYTFDIECTDFASNKCEDIDYGESKYPKSFTIDLTRPDINVEFIEEDNVNSGIYYQKARTAKIIIDELHFDKELASKGVHCTVSVDEHDNASGSSEVTLSEWTQIPDSNKYFATMQMSENALYILSVQYTDMAGNDGNSYQTSFYVDKSNPSLSVSVNDSKNRGAYSGKITADIKCDDTNFDENQLEISMSGVNVEVSECRTEGDNLVFTLKNQSGDMIDWKGTLISTPENSNKVYGKSVSFENFPEGANLKGFDDIYTLKVSVTDKAGRKSSEELIFSVNRFGSTYDITGIKDVLGTYSQSSPDIIVSEINPDELTKYSITLFKNNETITLKKGVDYDVEVIGDKNEWHEYIYKIPASNFTEDGVYSISLHSVDKAENVSENTLDTKDSEISFAVDSTPPKAVVANLESGETYTEESRVIVMTADDNLLLTEVEVYLDNSDTPLKKWDSSEIEKIFSNKDDSKKEFEFEIPGDSAKAHTLKVVCADAAGNKTELKYDNFYVTTDVVVQYANKKPVWFAVGAGILVLAGGAVFVIGKKKKKKRDLF